MDNLNRLTELIANDELPYAEALVRLYELCDRYELSSVTQTWGSASERHRERYGHRLRFGCCSGIDVHQTECIREPGAPGWYDDRHAF